MEIKNTMENLGVWDLAFGRRIILHTEWSKIVK